MPDNSGCRAILEEPLDADEIAAMEEPATQWLAKGLLAVDSNILIAAYPKSHKTNFVLETAVALASGTPLAGRFEVPTACRVGLVLMEGSKHHVRRRLIRLCAARGIALESLKGRLFFWYRPALRFASPAAMDALAEQIRERDLDLVAVDNWSYVSSGNSDKADEVAPQLVAFSDLRRARPGLTVLLVHHARKTQGDRAAGERLTDIIRGAGSFGGWYDTGLVFSRENESPTCPVIARVEMRELPSLAPFAFEVVDEHPGDPSRGVFPSGWMRLVALETLPETPSRGRKRDLSDDELDRRLIETVAAFSVISQRKLLTAVRGRRERVAERIRLLVQSGHLQDTGDNKGMALSLPPSVTKSNGNALGTREPPTPRSHVPKSPIGELGTGNGNASAELHSEMGTLAVDAFLVDG